MANEGTPAEDRSENGWGEAARKRPSERPSSTRLRPLRTTVQHRRVLVVENEAAERWKLEETVRRAGYQAWGAETMAEALALVAEQSFDAVLLDLMLPDMSGADGLPLIRELDPDVPVIISTATADHQLVQRAAMREPFDFAFKPLLDREVRNLLWEAMRLGRRVNVVGKSKAALSMLDGADDAAAHQSPVLLHGPRGTGKRLLARHIHESGPRIHRPYALVECAERSPSSIEAELFGSDGGSNGDVALGNPGILREAHRGTVVFNGIEHLPLPLQDRLWEVIDGDQLTPTGGRFDVRIILTTIDSSSWLEESGALGEGLREFLAEDQIRIPELSERTDDIPALAAHFIERHGGDQASSVVLTQRAFKHLMRREWPGNVAELEMVIGQALSLSETHVVDVQHFPGSG